MTIVNLAPKSDGPSINLVRTGPEPAEILLIHGLGSRASDFSRLVSRFGTEPSTVAPDLRGHGTSEASLPVAVEDFASDLVPLLDDEGPLAIVGFSFGSWVAMELWRMRPGMVSAVILVDPPLIYGPLFEWASRGGAVRWRIRSGLKWALGSLGLESLGRRVARSLAAPRDQTLGELTAIYHASDLDEAVALMRAHPLTGDLDDDDLISNARSLMAADRKTLLAGLELTGNPEEQDRPAGSEVEPVVLFGENSPVTDPESVESLSRRIGGRAVPYGGGHAAHLEVPDLIVAEIERFLPPAR